MADRSDVEAVLARYPEGALTPVQAIVILTSEHEGAPLDPERVDDAAVLLRAEALAGTGVPARTALAQARAELVAARRRAEPLIQTSSFSVPNGRPTIASGPELDVVLCATCGIEKPYVTRPDVPGLFWPSCGHPPIVLTQPQREEMR